jgi:signal transduction histidine kinase
MKNKYQFPQRGFFDYVGERKAAKFHPWIIVGLVVLYIVSFPILKAPILVTIPAVVYAWFYYRKGGLIASALAFSVNILLFNVYLDKVTWNALLNFDNGILLGHLFVLLVSIGIGYLREIIEGYYHATNQLYKRERHLVLTNMATKDILAGDSLRDIYYRLLTHLTNLFTADYAYLTRFDDASQKIHIVDTTRSIQQSFQNVPLEPGEADMVMSVFRDGHVLFIDDLPQFASANKISKFKTFQDSTRSAVLVPLITQDYRFGVAILGFDSPHAFDSEEINYIELTSRQITLALRSIHQERMINKQLKEAKTLANIEHALSKVERTGVNAVLQLIVDAARDMIPNTQRVVLHLLDDDRKYLVPRAVTGDSNRLTSRLRMLSGEGIAGQVIVTGEVATIADIRSDQRFVGQTSHPAFRSLIVVPIQSNERRIGTISAQSEEVGIFGPDETNLLSALGAQVAIAIENANLLETTQQNYKKINTLYHLTQNLATSLDVDQLMKDTVEFLQSVFGYYHIQIYIIDTEKGLLMARHGAGVIGNRLGEEGYSLPVGAGTIGHVAETGKPFFTNTVEEVVFFVRNPYLPDTHSEMVLPITINEKMWGVLNIQEVPSNPIYKKDMKLMEAVTQHLAIAIQTATLYTELQNSLRQEKNIRAQLIQSERLAVVGRLLASVSHELNNPLQAIQNALFLLKDEEKLSEQGYQDMEVILSETERMASMIGRLRDTYRTTQAGEFRDVDINSIVEDVVALISTYMRHRKIAFEFFPEPKLKPISGISEQIRQVMLNLFMNAIESMNKGGKIIVQTHNVEDQDQVMLSVTDTGTGISPEVFNEIFDPFVTNKKTGTGLGLTITRDIVLHHHGDIRAENNPQGGATFKVWFPVKERVKQ